MRRLSVRRTSVVVLLALAPLVSLVAQTTEKQEQVVYVTNTGTKYHRETCRSLARSRIQMPLEKAAARYGPCAICKPPVGPFTVGLMPGSTIAFGEATVTLIAGWPSWTGAGLSVAERRNAISLVGTARIPMSVDPLCGRRRWATSERSR